MNHRLFIALGAAILAQPVSAQSFVNWETPQINPLDMTPDGTKLLACNTADNRLEVFSLTANGPVKLGAVPVGLDPVTVRARSNSQAWVVNHISDDVSIVDLPTMRVINTISVGDEPTDVVFAGKPQRAFVCLSQLNQVKVYDPSTLAQIGSALNIEGEDPRALATDGTSVYAAIFESGNLTTIIPQTVVSSTVNPYPNDQNPPPNNGTDFSPTQKPGNPAPPAVSLIVKKINGNWLDDNPGAPGNWNAAVTWNLHDHDVAIIDANSLAISYVTGLMNLNMNIAIKPDGQVSVIGTDAINNVRFEPNVKGKFVRVKGATFPTGGGAATIADLNPHLDYTASTVAQDQRDLSIGDPRGIAWNSDGSRAYITGMGSNNLIVTDSSFARINQTNVGQGPTGVRFDEPRGLLYVLNRFDDTISVVNESSLSIVNTVPMFDPTPSMIKAGRPHLYNTHKTSGLGQASCASCHVDARVDQLAWDLGDPAGSVKLFNQSCQIPFPGACNNWHPMKGPMTSQTLVGAQGTEPMHWRGDRASLNEFNPAFINLMGDDVQLTPQEMAEFGSFLGTIKTPPQPNRNFDNSLKTSFPNGGNPTTGQNLFQTQPFDGGLITCVTCHAMPSGTNGQITPAAAIQETQGMKIPQLRNMYEKTGFFRATSAGSPPTNNNNRGFGFTHDGNIDTLFEFLKFPGFQFASGAAGDQQRRDIEAFLHSFPTDTHAAVGVQTTVLNGASVPAPQQKIINDAINLATSNVVGLVVKGRQSGIDRGYSYIGNNNFQSDRAAQIISAAALLASAGSGSELTYTVVPAGTQTRIGIDRDLDGYLDRDEIDKCSDPADPASIPAPNANCRADISPPPNGNGQVNVDDLLLVINSWGVSKGSPADIAPGCGNGMVNVDDLLKVINSWGQCPP